MGMYGSPWKTRGWSCKSPCGGSLVVGDTAVGMTDEDCCLRSIRRSVVVFLVGLVLSGVTAFPLVHELHWLLHITRTLHATGLTAWLLRVSRALDAQASEAPFLAYGTDWLAFGHLVIAAAFLGLWRDPVRNRWLVSWGLLACAGVVPLALFAGAARGIPPYWRAIDCSFGVFGCLPLLWVRRQIAKLERLRQGSDRRADALARR